MFESNTATDDKHFLEDKGLNHIPAITFDAASEMNFYVSQLHEALDLQRLFDIFTNKLREAVSCDSIEYKDDSTRTYMVDDISGKHQCVYALRYKEQSLGSISISRDSIFLEHEIETIEVMLAGLTLPLRNAISYKQAISLSQRDHLTGLKNRQQYHDAVESEIDRAQRYNCPFSVLMFDIDNFGDINKKYGRRVGDAVLIEVARRIEGQARSSDIVYSNGVDQFLVFLPETVKAEAIEAAERIKDFVLNYKCIVEDNAIPFTLSAGVATVINKETTKKLMDRVNSALLQAKRLGKNRIHGAFQADNIQAGY